MAQETSTSRIDAGYQPSGRSWGGTTLNAPTHATIADARHVVVVPGTGEDSSANQRAIISPHMNHAKALNIPRPRKAERRISESHDGNGRATGSARHHT